jgi:RNA polymerase sigma-70 factor (ECF subfamily)
MAVASRVLDPSNLEDHRRELTGYCYRMLGSGFEAEDAVQETLVRAWRAAEQFEGRSSLRSWLYRIATNVCLDMLKGSQRRARPMDLGASSPPDESHLRPMTAENLWVSPVADERVIPLHGDPAEVAAERESIRLAFITALQHLPARQRAALILFEVLRFPAAEVAELLGTSVAAVNSALQRARATLDELDFEHGGLGDHDEELLAEYLDAFERYDIPRLVTLLHEDAVQSMPPFELWLRGAECIATWMVEPGPSGCRGSRVLRGKDANGLPAFGQYRIDPEGGHAPWALQLLRIEDGRIAELAFFLDARLFPEFGLPSHLPPG